MIWIKGALFIGTLATVKYIFASINNLGDEKIIKMKELINFTQYLRVYSCGMKMPIEEIYEKYNFKSIATKILIQGLISFLEDQKEAEEFKVYISNLMYTPKEFNAYFAEIIDYYGYVYSDVLDKKLQLTVEEMEKVMKEFSLKHNEKKELNNRISFLAGCLAAIILI